MKKLFLIGAGGHCHSCIDVIEAEKSFQIAGIFDVKENIGKQVLGYEVIGVDSDLAKYVSNDHYFLITIGQIKNVEPRVRLFQLLKSLDAQMATVISPRAYVSKHSRVGAGTIVLHDALVNANASIGENCIINTKALIEHDTVIGKHCHVSTAAVVNGNCTIEGKSFVGSNAVLKEGVMLKEGSLVPAGEFFRGK